MKSIRLKLVLLFLFLVFIVMIVSGNIILYRVRSIEIENAKAMLESRTKSIKELVIENNKPVDFEKALQNLFLTNSEVQNQTNYEAISSVQGFILNQSGIDIAKSVKISLNFSRVITSAMNGDPSFSFYTRDYDTNGTTKFWSEYAFPVKNDSNNVDYIIYTRSSADYIQKKIADIVNIIIIASVIAFIITIILSTIFARSLTSPIIDLTIKSKEIAEGNLKGELTPKSKDEIGQLTESFNYMANMLSTTIASIESEKRKMEIVINNMTDGILAYDINGKLIHANKICVEILNLPNTAQITFEYLISLFNIDVNFVSDFNNNIIQDQTIFIKDKYITAFFSTYLNINENIEGIVVVLQDVTKYKKLDNMRREFVANVSHEIRTPLTTIKSYTETLLNGALCEIELATNFLKVIESEADRMTLLVKDLLELSCFDNQQFKIEFSEVDLINLIKEVKIQNNLSAIKNNQTIIFNPKLKEAKIHADRGRIIQVMSNIISNAIKYSVNQGTITIDISERPKFFNVNIADTGIGIEKDDINRIFERFYRVDKARSRAIGGTGLGLSIAKEIMQAHKGKIYVKSEIGIGTTITLRFLKYQY